MILSRFLDTKCNGILYNNDKHKIFKICIINLKQYTLNLHLQLITIIEIIINVGKAT